MKVSSRVVKSMSLPGSSVTGKSGEGLDFPAGLRVLVVDDDPTCLTILEKMLRACRYEVTKTNRAEVALTLLRENRNGFDIVISDVHMPDMDGLKLLEHVGLEMDLPVIMMSADDTRTVVMKGVIHGACDYLIKPITIQALKNIWQHVVRKKKSEWKDLEPSGSWEEGDWQQRQDEAVSSPTSEGGWKSSKRKGEEDESDDKDDSSAPKKPRVVWSIDLHQQFVAAVNQLGIDKAVPKKILELMNVSGLTRENVASHLQKYRLYLKRVSGESQEQFMPQDSGFAAMSSLDLQAFASTSQLSAQTLAPYSRMPSTPKPNMPMPFVDQRNIFTFENSKLPYVDGQQQNRLGNSGKQVNLLHGIPTIIEPKQFGGLNQLGGMNMHASSSSSHQTLGGMNMQRSSSHQNLGGMNMQPTSSHQNLGGMNMHPSSSYQSLGGMNMHPSSSSSYQPLGGMNMHTSFSSGHQSNSLLTPIMPQQQSRGHVVNGSQLPLGQTPPMQFNGSGGSSGILSRNGMAYNPIPPSTPPLIDFSVNQILEMPGSSFPIGSTPRITSIVSKGVNNQAEVSSNIKETRGYSPNYDVFQLQKPGMTFGSSSQLGKNSMNVSSSLLLSQSYVDNQKNEQNVNSFTGKQMFSSGLENQQMNPNQKFNGPPLVSNPMRMKTQIETNVFPEQYGQEDLMNVFPKQREEGTASGEFDFDGNIIDAHLGEYHEANSLSDHHISAREHVYGELPTM